MTLWNRLRHRGKLEEQLEKELALPSRTTCRRSDGAWPPSRRGTPAGPDGDSAVRSK